ncbi:MAG: ribokinase [Thaumarchaeota archaeon]|nr:ribokinase [Nitrososphaerota archaeon]
MKIGIISHSIMYYFINKNEICEHFGGSIYYGGTIAKNLNSKVYLYTKFGSDFIFRNKLLNYNFQLENSLSEKPTTRLKINLYAPFELYLQNLCEPINEINYESDLIMINPVFHEFDMKSLSKPIKSILFLDPCGFLRCLNNNNQILLSKMELDLKNISILKLTGDEAFCLTGKKGILALRDLQKFDIRYVILFQGNEIFVLDKNKLYTISDKSFKFHNRFGLIDIFNSAFCCTYINEHDILWALCFGGGAIQAAQEINNLNISNIPNKKMIETNAAYLYNLLKFTQL